MQLVPSARLAYACAFRIGPRPGRLIRSADMCFDRPSRGPDEPSSRQGSAASIVFTAALLLLLFAPLPWAQDSERDATWLEVRSPHFVVISNADEDQSRGVVEDFERARAMAHALVETLARHLSLPPGQPFSLDPDGPVIIIAVKDQQGMRQLLPQFWEGRRPCPAGVFWKGPNKYHIALRVDVADDVLYRRVVHEYVHLLRSVNLPGAPAWLDEGLSELVEAVAAERRSGARIRAEESIDVGLPVARHLRLLRSRSMLPIEELFSTARNAHDRDARNVAVFYAQSWALTHYFVFGERAGQLQRALPDYLGFLRQMADPIEAGVQAFGDLDELGVALDAYVRAGRFRSLRVDALTGAPRLANASLTVRGLSPAESLAARGNFLVYGERPKAAETLLSVALQLDPDQPLASESMGYLHFLQNEPEDALRWFTRAAATDRASYLTYFYRAVLSESTGRTEKTYTGGGTGVEQDLLRAISLNATFAPAHAHLAGLLATQPGRITEAVQHAQEAVALEPENSHYWVDLGQLLVGLQRFAEARQAAERGLAVAGSLAARERASSFLGGLEELEE